MDIAKQSITPSQTLTGNGLGMSQKFYPKPLFQPLGAPVRRVLGALMEPQQLVLSQERGGRDGELRWAGLWTRNLCHDFSVDKEWMAIHVDLS